MGFSAFPKLEANQRASRKVDAASGETFHAYPYPLADGRHMLILVTASSVEQNAIYRISLDGKEKKQVTKANRGFGYVSPRENETVGHLLVMRQQTLMALPVNPNTIEPAGDPFPVADQVGNSLSQAFFSVSPSGSLAYRVAGSTGSRQLTWFDRTGKLGSHAWARRRVQQPEPRAMVPAPLSRRPIPRISISGCSISPAPFHRASPSTKRKTTTRSGRRMEARSRSARGGMAHFTRCS